jgi:hypothetical protein
MGTSAIHYNLHSSRAQQDHHESNLLGLQAGRYLNDHLAVEFGYAQQAGHDDSSTQLMFGLGIAKRLRDKFDLRADIRMLSGLDENGEDVGFHISLNRIFGTPPPLAGGSATRGHAGASNPTQTRIQNAHCGDSFERQIRL